MRTARDSAPTDGGALQRADDKKSAALARARLDDGACGPAAIGPDGELERTPSVLEVRGDELIFVP